MHILELAAVPDAIEVRTPEGQVVRYEPRSARRALAQIEPARLRSGQRIEVLASQDDWQVWEDTGGPHVLCLSKILRTPVHISRERIRLAA